MVDPTIPAEVVRIAEKILGYKKLLGPLKPDLKNIILDFRTGKAEMTMHLYVPAEKRHLRKVLIPDSEGFSIIEMYDSTFARVDKIWKRTKKGLSLHARSLPKGSEHFILRAAGTVPREGLQHFLEVDKATDCFDMKGEDVYWVSCALTEVGYKALRKMYEELEIQNVFLTIRVGVRACFTTTIPHELDVILRAKDEYISATLSKDRERIRKAKHRMDSLRKLSAVSERDIYKTMAEMVARPVFQDYVYATGHFGVGEVFGEDLRLSPVPDVINVEAITVLSYKQRKASGELCFRREDYKKEVRKRMEGLLR